MGGTRSKVEGGDRHDLEPEGTREDKRHEFIQVRVAGVATLRLVWSIAPCAWMLFPGGIVHVHLGTRPSFI
jgi:hypothetical protein